MIQHLVLVQLRDSTAESEAESLAQAFRDMQRHVGGVVEARAGFDFSGRCRPYSLVAVLRLSDREALDRYLSDPRHLDLVRRLDALSEHRLVADFEAD
ncbi:MAG TPA: Dabb family protein [Chloroflexota bacterium]|nr:Dabb family protein [Chloroflexota bacterium]